MSQHSTSASSGRHVPSRAASLSYKAAAFQIDSRLPSRSSSLNQSVVFRKSKALTALLIGINEYATLPPLNGAVPDVQRMRDQLLAWGVDDANITLLLDKAATREAIIQTFEKLSEGGRTNNPILIFYAGHGGLALAPKELLSRSRHRDSMIECLMPVDFAPVEGVHGIPGYTIDALVNQIARKRTENITIVTDSCFSGNSVRISATRDPTLQYRRYLPHGIYSLPSGLDADIYGRDDTAALFDQDSIKSSPRKPFVHLSACTSRELAGETSTGGLFTSALLKLFSTPGFSPDRTSYLQVLQKMDLIDEQHPQLDAINGHHPLFGGGLKGPVDVFYPVRKLDDGSGMYVLEGGYANGVCFGAKFALYPDVFALQQGGTPLSIMETWITHSTHSYLQPVSEDKPDLPEQMVAFQVEASEEEVLKVYAKSMEPGLKDTLLKRMDGARPRSQKLMFVPHPENANIEFGKSNDGRTIIKHLDTRVTKHGLDRVRYPIPPNPFVFEHILSSAARFFFHLNREHGSYDISSLVSVSLFQVANPPPGPGVVSPMSKVPVSENLIQNGCAVLDLPRGGRGQKHPTFGLEIKNLDATTKWFLSVFYFDMSDLSIVSYHNGPSPNVHQPEPTLGPGEEHLIGYGAPTKRGLEFMVPDGQTVDIGFLKFFFSTQPVDLSHVQQKSPFAPQVKRAVYEADAREDNPLDSYWATLTVPIVQRCISNSASA